MRKVLVIDTSVLYVWLKVSGKETCGPSNALVTYEKVSEKIEEEKKKGETERNMKYASSYLLDFKLKSEDYTGKDYTDRTSSTEYTDYQS